MASKIILVVFFRFEECFQGVDRGHDGSVICFSPVELLDYLLGDVLLFLIVVENYRTILRANVITLTIQSCWVMGCEEDLKNLPVGDDARIISNLENLHVPRCTSRNLFVGRLRGVASRIAGVNPYNALYLAEDSLGAPEASASKRCRLSLSKGVGRAFAHDTNWSPGNLRVLRAG